MTDQDAVQAQTCQDPFETQSNWPEKARNAVVRRGIKLVCGSADFVPTTAASDVSLVSAGLLRLAVSRSNPGRMDHRRAGDLGAGRSDWDGVICNPAPSSVCHLW